MFGRVLPHQPVRAMAAAAVKYEQAYVQMQMTCMPYLTLVSFHEAYWQRGRPPGTVIDEIIVHATESASTTTYEECLRYLVRKNGREVSCHYIIGPRHCQIAQMVKDNRRARHAGSKSEGGKDKGGGHNSHSIGIELFKRKKDTSPYSDFQYEALGQLCTDLMIRHNLTRSQIIAHAATSETRQGKLDPRNFDWGRLDKTVERINARIRRINPMFARKLQEVDRPDYLFAPVRIRRRRKRGG